VDRFLLVQEEFQKDSIVANRISSDIFTEEHGKKKRQKEKEERGILN